MLCENLIISENQELDLSVTVRLASLDVPRSEEDLKEELLAHALDCHECLTVVLFQEGSLADDGCATYRRLFSEATEELARQETLVREPRSAEMHLSNEFIEDFFLDRLSPEEMNLMADHVDICGECSNTLQQRQSLQLCLQAAAKLRKEGAAPQTGMDGLLEIRIPEKNLHYSTRIKG